MLWGSHWVMEIQWIVHSDCKGVKWALLPSHYQKNDQIIDLKLQCVVLWWNLQGHLIFPRTTCYPNRVNFHEDCQTIRVFIKLRYFSSPWSSLVGTEPLTNFLLFLMMEKLQGSLKSGTYTFSLIYTAREVGTVHAWSGFCMKTISIQNCRNSYSSPKWVKNYY